MVEYGFSRAELRNESDYASETDIRATNPNEVHRKTVRAIQNLGYTLRNEGIGIQKGAIGESYGTIEGRIYADKEEFLSDAGRIKLNPYKEFGIAALGVGVVLLFICMIFGGEAGIFFGLIALLVLVCGIYLYFMYSKEYAIPARLKSIFRVLEEGEATETSEESVSGGGDRKTIRHYITSNLSILLSSKVDLRVNSMDIVDSRLKEKISSMSESEFRSLWDRRTVDKLHSTKQKMTEDVSEISDRMRSFAEFK